MFSYINFFNKASFNLKNKIPLSILLGLIMFFGISGEVVAESRKYDYSQTQDLYAVPDPNVLNNMATYWKNNWNVFNWYWLMSPNISINYEAQAIDFYTGQNISSGSNLPVGKKITFHVTHDYSDVTWSASGGYQDSPYGDWSANAEPSASVTCDANDLTASSLAYLNNGTYETYYDYATYFPLKVNPPTKSLINTDGLTCDPAVTSNDNKGWDISCVVNKVGTLSGSVNFTNTIGKFYFRMAFTRNSSSESLCAPENYFGADQNGKCCMGGSNKPIQKNSTDPFILSIPTTTIPFTFTGTAGTPPTKPSITCPPSNSIINQTKIFSFSSDAADNKTVRYGVDLNNDNFPDGWTPTYPDYVSSGVEQTYPHAWSSVTSTTVKVIATDSAGFNSDWSNGCDIDVVDTKQCLNGEIIPINQECPFVIPPTVDARLTPNIVNRESFCTATSTLSSSIPGITCNVYKTGQNEIYVDISSESNFQVEPGFRYNYICKDLSGVEVARSRELYCAINPSVFER